MNAIHAITCQSTLKRAVAMLTGAVLSKLAHPDGGLGFSSTLQGFKTRKLPVIKICNKQLVKKKVSETTDQPQFAS